MCVSVRMSVRMCVCLCTMQGSVFTSGHLQEWRVPATNILAEYISPDYPWQTAMTSKAKGELVVVGTPLTCLFYCPPGKLLRYGVLRRSQPSLACPPPRSPPSSPKPAC